MVSRKRREKVETLSRAERVRMATEELGPTFVKMGQILSTRPERFAFLLRGQYYQRHYTNWE